MQIFLIITAVIFAAACGILSVLCLSQRRRLHAQSLRIGEERPAQLQKRHKVRS